MVPSRAAVLVPVAGGTCLVQDLDAVCASHICGHIRRDFLLQLPHAAGTPSSIADGGEGACPEGSGAGVQQPHAVHPHIHVLYGVSVGADGVQLHAVQGHDAVRPRRRPHRVLLRAGNVAAGEQHPISPAISPFVLLPFAVASPLHGCCWLIDCCPRWLGLCFFGVLRIPATGTCGVL